MKYKLELWKYTPYEYEEATAHLNDMAAKGWALQDIATVWLPLACYEKSEDAVSYRYTMEIVSEVEDEDMCILCQDAGWERVLQRPDAAWVFRTRQKDAKPLFADSAQRREAAWENYRNSSRPAVMLGTSLLCLGILAALFYLGRYEGISSWLTKSMYWMFAALFVCVVSSELANYLWLRNCTENRQSLRAERPEWLRKFSLATNYIAVLVLLAFLVIKGIEVAMAGNTIGVIWIALCPVLFLSGAYIKLALQCSAPGWIVMIAGVMAFFTDLSV